MFSHLALRLLPDFFNFFFLFPGLFVGLVLFVEVDLLFFCFLLFGCGFGQGRHLAEGREKIESWLVFFFLVVS